ncbi:aldo/keto reductase [Micromonospora sp. NPDC005979]|uniref:aldo/keto reductase n=1 Tax=Micromonospora sp. NPDC005979 TaxID=3156726 RepID=UPI0033B23D9F
MPVERIIFGTMTLGYHGRGARVRDVPTARRMLDQFRSRGYREIDTCYVYGAPLPAELLIAIDEASETTRPAWPSTRRA